MNSKKYIFGYGSLISKKSIIHTIGKDPGELFQVELQGWIRDWSVVLDNTTTIRRFELLPGHTVPRYVAALNIRKSKNDELASNPNGVVFEVTDADLKKMDEREDHYARKDVTNDIVGISKDGIKIYAYVGKEEFCAQEYDEREVIVPQSYLSLVETNFTKKELAKFRATTLSTHYPILPTVHSSGM